MKNISIYDITGRILRTVNCPESQVAVQIKVGEAYVEGEFSSDEFQIRSEVLEKLPPKPTEYHLFNYTSQQWQDPRTPATEWPLVRVKRDALLSETDWVITKAMEMGTPVPDAWKVYRQALRNITTQADPFALTWPVVPA